MTDWRDKKRCVSGEMPEHIVYLGNSATPVPGERKWHAGQELFLDFLV